VEKPNIRVRWGQRIREARGDALTQRQLADAVGVSAAAICYWENGVTAPKPDFQVAIATALGRTHAELFALDDEAVA
jgi:transcriptional regulator with XRE-family HTH domain